MRKDEIDNFLLSIDSNPACIESIPARSVVYLFKFGWLSDDVTSLVLSSQSKKRIIKIREEMKVSSSTEKIIELILSECAEKKRPVSKQYIARTLSIESKVVAKVLSTLESQERIKKINTSGNNFGIKWASIDFNPLVQTSDVFDINNLFT